MKTSKPTKQQIEAARLALAAMLPAPKKAAR